MIPGYCLKKYVAAPLINPFGKAFFDTFYLFFNGILVLWQSLEAVTGIRRERSTKSYCVFFSNATAAIISTLGGPGLLNSKMALEFCHPCIVLSPWVPTIPWELLPLNCQLPLLRIILQKNKLSRESGMASKGWHYRTSNKPLSVRSAPA